MKQVKLLLIFFICSAESCLTKKEIVQPITPIANFSFELGKNGEVRFKNNSQNAENYQWEFGDGDFSVDKNPVHFYKEIKNYKINLIAKSIDNISNEYTADILVDTFEPKSNFTFELLENGKVKFTNLSKFATEYTWSFGNNTDLSNEINPIHTFRKNGTYNISLKSKNKVTEHIFTKEIIINNISNSYLSECNITEPKSQLSWINKDNWSNLKGFYLYVYYGFIEKKDSKYLDQRGYFKDKDIREIVIVRISKEKRDEISIKDWILIYDCSGKLIDEGWVEDWLTLPTNLKNKYVSDANVIN